MNKMETKKLEMDDQTKCQVKEIFDMLHLLKKDRAEIEKDKKKINDLYGEVDMIAGQNESLEGKNKSLIKQVWIYM
jgi:FtsZ-binding cell division protein ZapB